MGMFDENDPRYATVIELRQAVIDADTAWRADHTEPNHMAIQKTADRLWVYLLQNFNSDPVTLETHYQADDLFAGRLDATQLHCDPAIVTMAVSKSLITNYRVRLDTMKMRHFDAIATSFRPLMVKVQKRPQDQIDAMYPKWAAVNPPARSFAPAAQKPWPEIVYIKTGDSYTPVDMLYEKVGDAYVPVVRA